MKVHRKMNAPSKKFEHTNTNWCRLGMAIPRKISFLEESRSRGIAIYHFSGIEEDEIYSSGIRGISRN